MPRDDLAAATTTTTTVCGFIFVYLTPELGLGRRGQQVSNELLAAQRRVVIRGLRGLNRRHTPEGQTTRTENTLHSTKMCSTHTHTPL